VRTFLALVLSVYAASAFATDPPIDVTEAENQFTQATVDAVVIDGACAQTRTDRRTCYQRASVLTAHCREQLLIHYSDARTSALTVSRDDYLAALQTCVSTQAK
jgi:hypothetical protein